MLTHAVRPRASSGFMTLRQTLFLGAGLGILPHNGLFQILSRFDSEVDLRVVAAYADVLARA